MQPYVRFQTWRSELLKLQKWTHVQRRQESDMNTLSNFIEIKCLSPTNKIDVNTDK